MPKSAKRPRKNAPKARRKKPKLTARNADRHVLYQASVQDVASEARFVARTFERVRGRKAVTLREDFCGSALLCAEWVKKSGRTAVGVDLDPSVLAWGIERNLAPIGEPGNRVRLFEQDVRAKVPGKFDVTVALNFSYFVFRTREDLRGYFASVRRSMAEDGLFFVDLYGGYESMKVMRESTRIRGFKYVWDQAEVNPIDHSVTNHIHFEFDDGSKLNEAFTYEWRLWTIPELRELLEEAGFSKSTVYWEDANADGEGTGTFRPKERADQEAAFVAYIVAER
jgi:SAM-dependent methyltransferase